MGIGNSGTTMMGRWEDGLLDLEAVGGMGVGMMHQHLEVIDSFCEGGVGACIPLEVAATSVDPFISITPTIGMVRGEGDIEVVANVFCCQRSQ